MFIKNFGLFWRRDEIMWNPGRGAKDEFRLLGRRGMNAPGIRVADFRFQQGIYILYGDHGPHYVGLTTKQGLGKRLKDHLTDQHGQAWDRFSWFGFCKVLEDKEAGGIRRLKAMANHAAGKPDKMIRDVEALLIRAMGLRNINKNNFSEADEWEQVKLDEMDRFLSKLN